VTEVMIVNRKNRAIKTNKGKVRAKMKRERVGD
jgi:hypothetical protein